MSIPKIIGAAMVTSVFVGIFAVIAIGIGVLNTLSIFGAAIAITAFWVIGITLLTHG